MNEAHDWMLTLPEGAGWVVGGVEDARAACQPIRMPAGLEIEREFLGHGMSGAKYPKRDWSVPLASYLWVFALLAAARWSVEYNRRKRQSGETS